MSIPETMRAIVVRNYGSADALCVESLPIPQPGPGEVLVRLIAAGVNPVDTYLRSGSQGYRPTLPFTPGWDGAGVVKDVGEGVSRVKAHDAVYLSHAQAGTYAEYCICPATHVFPLPPGLTAEEGAALGVPYATAWYALFETAHLKPKDRVLVHGASGGVGMAAVQWALSQGATVVGTAGTEAGLARVYGEGAYAVLHSSDGYLQEAVELADGPFDVIVEMAAHLNLQRDLEVLARGGRVVVVGSRGEVQITPRALMARQASICGMSLRNVSPPAFERIHAAIQAAAQRGTIRPVLGPHFLLEEASDAHRVLEQGGATGKVILRTAPL